MNTIDHTVAEFDVNSLTRGYSVAGHKGILVYCKKISRNQAHFIVHDVEGFWEYSSWVCRDSAQECADMAAKDITAEK